MLDSRSIVFVFILGFRRWRLQRREKLFRRGFQKELTGSRFCIWSSRKFGQFSLKEFWEKLFIDFVLFLLFLIKSSLGNIFQIHCEESRWQLGSFPSLIVTLMYQKLIFDLGFFSSLLSTLNYRNHFESIEHFLKLKKIFKNNSWQINLTRIKWNYWRMTNSRLIETDRKILLPKTTPPSRHSTSILKRPNNHPKKETSFKRAVNTFQIRSIFEKLHQNAYSIESMSHWIFHYFTLKPIEREGP